MIDKVNLNLKNKEKKKENKVALWISNALSKVERVLLREALCHLCWRDSLDKELEKRGHKFARYADDFTLLVKSRRVGERVLHSISNYLQNRLKLIVNTTKSRVVKTSQSKFLGFIFKTRRIQLPPKILETFKQRVRELTNRN